MDSFVAYGAFIKRGNQIFRTNTYLKWGSSEKLIGACVLCNPGTEMPENLDSAEITALEEGRELTGPIKLDPTMEQIKKLVEEINKDTSVEGVFPIYSLYTFLAASEELALSSVDMQKVDREILLKNFEDFRHDADKLPWILIGWGFSQDECIMGEKVRWLNYIKKIGLPYYGRQGRAYYDFDHPLRHDQYDQHNYIEHVLKQYEYREKESTPDYSDNSVKPESAGFYYDKGNELLKSGNFEEAIEMFKKAADLEHSISAPSPLFSDALYGMGTHEKIAELYGVGSSPRQVRKSEPKLASRGDTGIGTDNVSKNKGNDAVSLQKALDELNSLAGLANVKDEIGHIVKLIEFEANRSKILGIPQHTSQNFHFVFTGNPGTGKTTVARLIGDIFKSLGVLEKGHLVEVDRSQIVGRYQGETAVLTKEAIDRAMGGVLLIDEAHALARSDSGRDYGVEAVDTLVKAMEDCRDQFIVILAGYTEEMRNLFKLNPGLKSRIGFEIHFEDYSDDEMLQIARSIAQKNFYELSKDSEEPFLQILNRKRVDESFANARTVRNVIEEAIREKAYRVGNKTVSSEELKTLLPADFEAASQHGEEDKLQEYLKELDHMTGLDYVKNMVNQIISFVQLQKKKKEMGLEAEDVTLHMIFTGNPGTGKTTVARILGKILNAMGILKKGHLIEASRESLVGQYVGQTAPKTLEKIKESYGGILFIDEAYSLASGGENDFGREAIATLIKEMEDNRDKLIVILAGYTNEMEELLDTNPGLSSRIGFTIKFPDYTPEELVSIFKQLCLKSHYILTEEAEQKVLLELTSMYQLRDKNFGNARSVRKLFENIKMQQALRVSKTGLSGQDILKILPEDVACS